MDIEPTGIIIRVREENGHWDNIDLALLSAIQQKEFLSTVDEEKSYAWLPTIIMELCKKQAQNAKLVAALEWLDTAIMPGERKYDGWGCCKIHHDILVEFDDKVKQALAQVKEE